MSAPDVDPMKAVVLHIRARDLHPEDGGGCPVVELADATRIRDEAVVEARRAERQRSLDLVNSVTDDCPLHAEVTCREIVRQLRDLAPEPEEADCVEPRPLERVEGWDDEGGWWPVWQLPDGEIWAGPADQAAERGGVPLYRTAKEADHG